MEVVKDIEELEQNDNGFCVQQAKWQLEDCGHCFWGEVIQAIHR
jgi:hypothetical protein